MTFRMKPEYDRKGRASASAGSGATIIRLPTDKENFTCLKSRLVLQVTPSKIEGYECASTGPPSGLHNCL